MKNQLQLAIVGSLTLGLAPFFPHAHIWKQLTNIWYGRPMLAMDWLDLAMHGAPWVFLIYVLTRMGIQKYKTKKAINK